VIPDPIALTIPAPKSDMSSWVESTFVSQDAGKFAGEFAEFLDTNVGVTDPSCENLNQNILCLQIGVDQHISDLKGLVSSFEDYCCCFNHRSAIAMMVESCGALAISQKADPDPPFAPHLFES
jgi:hypothetical protein